MENSEGYQSLLAAVRKDAEKEQGCFNPAGCDHVFYDGNRRVSACFHRYCDKIPWVLERARHYAEKTGLEPGVILDAWEAQRNYWYMNFYQDANQPLLDAANIRIFDSREALRQAAGEQGFRCPRCGGVSTSPYACDSGQEMEPGKICDWRVYGLFADLGKGAFVFVKEIAQGQRIFMPVAWET